MSTNTSMRRAFKRIDTEYRQPAGYDPAPGYYAGPGGTTMGGMAPGGVAYTPFKTFSASRAYDKLTILVILAVVSAAFGYAVVPGGVAIGCLVVAFGLALVSWFRMQWSKVLAPAYSVFEGVGLGAVSAVYVSLGHGIVPLAIVFTAAVFIGALVLYRTGLVRVTPRMMSLAFMGALGIVAVSALSLLGLSLPGVNSLGTFGLIFGVVALAIAVLNLFTDFAYVSNAEASQLSADGEWAAAFAMMTALVLVYISILRILASAYGGRRS